MTHDDMSEKKNLRSSDTAPADTSNLFKFQLPIIIPDYSQPLVIKEVRGDGTSEAAHSKVDENLKAKQSAPEKFQYRSRPSGPKTDPLGDEHYVTYHRKMEREEKSVQRLEQERNATEMDRLSTQREQLLSTTWPSALQRITLIDNPRDATELDTKRDLTLREIDLYLNKYKAWKKRELLLKPQKKAGKHIVSFFSPRVKKKNHTKAPFGKPLPRILKSDFRLPEPWARKFAPDKLD